jgi:flagellar motor switch protein FliM
VEPILDKKEINDLLAAIKSGAVNLNSSGEDTGNKRLSRVAREVDIFEIYRHDSVSGEMRIPNLDIILDMFARNLGNTLTSALQQSFIIERSEITTATFEESIIGLDNKGAVGIYNTDPLKYGCLFHIDTLLAFTLIELMLGSTSTEDLIIPERNLTTIEINVVEGIMTSIARDFNKAILPVIKMRSELIRCENNFRLVNIVDADAEILNCRFQLKTGTGKAGELRLIIPYLTLEPIRDKFKEFVSVTQASYTWGSFFGHEVLEMKSNVVARSGAMSMSIREIMNMKTGDIINLEYNPDRPLEILIEDKVKFLAVPGKLNGKKAFHVTGRFSNRLGENNGSTK